MQESKKYCFYDEKEHIFKDITININLSFSFKLDDPDDTLKVNDKLKSGSENFSGQNLCFINILMKETMVYESLYEDMITETLYKDSEYRKIYPCSSKELLEDMERIERNIRPIFISKNRYIPIDYLIKNNISVFKYQKYISPEAILKHIKLLDWNYSSLHKYLPKDKDVSDDILLYLSSYKNFNIIHYITYCSKSMSKHNIRYFFFNYILKFITKNIMNIREVKSKIDNAIFELKYEKDSGPLLNYSDMIDYIYKLTSKFSICFNNLYIMPDKHCAEMINAFLNYDIVNDCPEMMNVLFNEKKLSEYNFTPTFSRIMYRDKIPYFSKCIYINYNNSN